MHPEILIFLNGPDAIYFITGKLARPVTNRVSPLSRKINDKFESELALMKQQLQRRNGILVYFNTIAWRWYLPTEDKLQDLLPLRLIVRASDGGIYKINS